MRTAVGVIFFILGVPILFATVLAFVAAAATTLRNTFVSYDKQWPEVDEIPMQR